jgi:hypothetical protein
MTATACSDFLDVEPDEQISIDQQLSDRDGVLAAISGVYTDIETVISSKLHVYSGILSGNMTFSPSLSSGEINASTVARIEDTYNFNNIPQSNEYESVVYDAAYNIVNQSNLLLERLEGMEFFTSTEKNQIRAELLVARAFSHYQVSLLFAQNIDFTGDGSHLGIVYNQRVLQAGTDFPSRSTAAMTYSFMREDLEEALTLFTGPQILNLGAPSSYFNEITTKAILAKIALQNNDWQRAADLANEVILTSGLQLTPAEDYINQWQQPDDLSETILSFAVPRGSEGDVSSSIAAYYNYAGPTNYADFVASGDLLELFTSDDIRSQLYQLQSLSTSTSDGREDRDYFFTIKYQPTNATLYTRLSDMYLIHAEALERLNPGSTIAIDRLNAIRQRAGLTALTSGADILEEIFLERRRELAFENNTIFDIIRYEKDIVRDQGCVANPCNLDYPSPFFILPIPQSSISNNENIEQNEGY